MNLENKVMFYVENLSNFNYHSVEHTNLLMPRMYYYSNHLMQIIYIFPAKKKKCYSFICMKYLALVSLMGVIFFRDLLFVRPFISLVLISKFTLMGVIFRDLYFFLL